MAEFPVDETTLTLLDAACQINPDNGQTNLQAFLEMGAKEKSVTEISEPGDPVPVYEVEYEEGYEPFTEHEAIHSLIAEIRRLRTVPPELRGK